VGQNNEKGLKMGGGELVIEHGMEDRGRKGNTWIRKKQEKEHGVEDRGQKEKLAR
jgi:hypothetical protein